MSGLRQAFRSFKHRARVAKALRSLQGPKPYAVTHGLDTPLIVSLTSYPPRFDLLARTLRCLLRQTLLADATVLWITQTDMHLLPADVLALQSDGLTIKPCAEMKSFSKILPALEKHPEATIVTADDDVFYAADWLDGLVEAARTTPAKVICRRAHEVTLDDKRNILAYTKWPSNIAGPAQSGRVFPTGVGGVLYRPDAFDSRVRDYALARRLCTNADDIWLYWMHRMRGTTAYKIPAQTRVLEWNPDIEVSLRATNLTQGGNDKQIEQMCNHFGFPAFDD